MDTGPGRGAKVGEKVIWIGIALFVGFGIVGVIMPYKLVRYRTDIRPGQSPFSGASSIVQVNYMSPANYSEEGRPLLERLYFVTTMQFVGGALFLIGLFMQWS